MIAMSQPSDFLAPGHDHAHCIAAALDQAEHQCRAQGARLTSQRRRVLEIVWTSHAPIGAYAILEQLAGEGSKPAPMTVYRALDFLQAQGLVHKVAGLNAFVGCSQPGATHDGQFLICRECGAVAEIHDATLDRAVAACAVAAGFKLTQGRIELEGVCTHCQPAYGSSHE